VTRSVLKGQGILSNSFNDNMSCAVDKFDVSKMKTQSNRISLCGA
jgi:hypothetical protein